MAQNQILDSLWHVYNSKNVSDTTRLDALHQLIDKIQRSEPDSAYQLALREIKEAQQLKLRKQEAKGYTILGLLESDKGNFYEATLNQEKALAIMTDLKNKKGIANCLNNIGINYLYQSDYTKALDYYLKALKQREEMNDSAAMSQSYSNIGIVYSELKEYNTSLMYFFKSLNIKIKLNDKNIAISYSNIAALFGNKKMFKAALFYERKSLGLSIAQSNKKLIAQSYNNIASSFQELKQSDSALYYQNKCIELREIIGDKMGLAISYGNLVSIYASLKEYTKAIAFGEKSLAIIKEIGATELEIGTHQSLSLAYGEARNYEKSLYHHRLYTQIKDSVFNLEKTKELSDLKTNFEVEKAQQKLNEAAKQKQQKISVISSISVFIVLLISLFVYFQYKKQTYEQEKNKALLEQKLLRLQMNPHFIFNCLGTIQSYVAMSKPLEANRYLANLAIVMRRVLEDSKFEYINLQQEITFLDNYLKLQSLVLNDELNYSIACENTISLEATNIPTMLIQPFIENAIVHGISKNKNKAGFISVSFTRINHSILCCIEDNGIGILNSKEHNNKQHNSMAIQIVKERLAFLQKKSIKDISISITNLYDDQKNSMGTKVELHLPFLISHQQK